MAQHFSESILMLSSRERKSLRIILCLLLLVGPTTASVEHSHEQGAHPHAHGVGIVHLPGDLPVVVTANDEASPSVSRHRHVVIFGVEFYSTEEPLSSSTNRWPEFSEDTLLILNVETRMPTLAPVVASLAAMSPLALSSPVEAMPLVVPLLARATSATRCQLCDCARGERTGVRLT